MFSYWRSYKKSDTRFTYLGIEEVRVAFELIGKSLVRSVEEFSFVLDSLLECFVYLILDVIVVILGLFILVVLKQSLDFFLKLVLFMVKVRDHSIVLFLFFVVYSL